MTSNKYRGFIWAGVSLSLGLFILFKLYYPYPNMVMDSYIYVEGAVQHLGANRFPIGYSWFLEIFTFFSHSASLLVWLQYLLLEGACLWLFLTVLRFFRPGKAITCLLIVALFCNPILLFISNFIMADALFVAISIFWVTQLIWIIGRPRPYMIWVHALMLVFAFTVRYNALFYPIIASLFILISRLSPGYKGLAIVVQFMLLSTFVRYTQEENRDMTGVRQFSPVGGWHLANNALYMYAHVYRNDKDVVPAIYQNLDSAVRYYFDTTRHEASLLVYERSGSGDFYENNDESPLRAYMYRRYGVRGFFQSFRAWGAMGEVCSEYGMYLIRRHPLDYFEYYMWPNTIRYFCPPREIFIMYSPYFLRSDELGKMTSQYLDLKTLTVGWRRIFFRDKLFEYYPVLFALLNVLFLISAIGWLVLGGRKQTDNVNVNILMMVGLLWVLNFGFSIFSASIFLRYQVFILIMQAVFGLLFLHMILSSRESG